MSPSRFTHVSPCLESSWVAADQNYNNVSQAWINTSVIHERRRLWETDTGHRFKSEHEPIRQDHHVGPFASGPLVNEGGQERSLTSEQSLARSLSPARPSH
ncbi:hypothetical protein BD414DRAFT_493592 [Trametes punicea]|nr:hypothetical protein BD414DRAFT_493592 [Trametes punicea]